MNVEIKLDDPAYCDGCPCISYEELDTQCNLGYWHLPSGDHIAIEGAMFDGRWRSPRPKECITKQGL
jgi:hypothetical protein